MTVDDRPGTWAHTSGNLIILMGLTPGDDKVRIELADPNHKILAGGMVAVTVPDQKASRSPEHR